MSNKLFNDHSNDFYINTTPHRADVFSPPVSTENYYEWFIRRYHESLAKGAKPNSGIAQNVTRLIAHVKHSKIEVDVYTHGPFGKAAADALIEISKGVLRPNVIEQQKEKTT